MDALGTTRRKKLAPDDILTWKPDPNDESRVMGTGPDGKNITLGDVRSRMQPHAGRALMAANLDATAEPEDLTRVMGTGPDGRQITLGDVRSSAAQLGSHQGVGFIPRVVGSTLPPQPKPLAAPVPAPILPANPVEMKTAQALLDRYEENSEQYNKVVAMLAETDRYNDLLAVQVYKLGKEYGLPAPRTPLEQMEDRVRASFAIKQQLDKMGGQEVAGWVKTRDVAADTANLTSEDARLYVEEMQKLVEDYRQNPDRDPREVATRYNALLDKAHQAELAARQRKDAATEAKRKETLKAEKAEVQEEKDIAKEQKAEAEKVRGRQEEALKVEISSHESRAKAKQTRLDRLVEKRDKATLTHDTDVATLEKMKPEDKRRGKLESDIAAYKGRQDEIDRLQAEVEEHEKQAESLRQQYIGSLRGESAQPPPSAGPQATQAPPPGAAPAGGAQAGGAQADSNWEPHPQNVDKVTHEWVDGGLSVKWEGVPAGVVGFIVERSIGDGLNDWKPIAKIADPNAVSYLVRDHNENADYRVVPQKASAGGGQGAGAAPAGGEQPAGQAVAQPAEQPARQDSGLEMTVLEEIEAMPAEAKRWGPVMEKYHDRLSVQELARLVAKFKEWGIPR